MQDDYNLKKYCLLLLVIINYTMISMSVSFAYGQIDLLQQRVKRVSDNSGNFQTQPEDVYVFPNITGPSDRTVVPEFKMASWEQYSTGSNSRLAILLTDTDSAWLPLVQGLKSIGVPFVITRDYKQALEHKVVLVYPTISGKVLSPEALRALTVFPRNGGTLIGVDVVGGGLNETFGFKSVSTSAQQYSIKLNPADSPLLSSFTDVRERTISMGDRREKTADMGVYMYKSPKFSPLAVYEDGTAAITQRTFGKGNAYAWGIDIGFLLHKGYSGRGETMARGYINEFEPTIDVVLRLLKEMYLTGSKDAVTLGTVPFNQSLSVLMTHDIDYGKSEENAIIYAEFEQSNKVPATYFCQTKYIKDWNDTTFFDGEHVPMLKKVGAMGMELGSHSVAHAYAFNEFPFGTGEERYPSYQPFVSERYTAHNGSVLGELRVSKYLIEALLGTPPVVSFRPGHLSDPKILPQALEAAKYLYSSTATANVSLTHFPFPLTYQYESQAETHIFEFPITIEDEIAPRMGDRVPQAIELARNISKYGGIFVVLIHPNILDHKLKFEKEFVDGVKDFAWFSTIGDFGRWWTARNKVELDVAQEGSLKIVTVNVPEPMEGLTIKVPKDWKLQQGGQDVNNSQELDSILIRKAAGKIRLAFAVN